MKKKYYLVAILLMLVGFAAVSTTLYINGSAKIKANKDDFHVYYSNALVNGEQDLSVIVDDTHISFTTTLDTLGQTYELEYEVTNGSKNYDAELEMVCTSGNEYLSVTNEFDDENILESLDTRNGILTLELVKSYTGDDLEVSIECTLSANAEERDSLGVSDGEDYGEEIDNPPINFKQPYSFSNPIGYEDIMLEYTFVFYEEGKATMFMNGAHESTDIYPMFDVKYYEDRIVMTEIYDYNMMGEMVFYYADDNNLSFSPDPEFQMYLTQGSSYDIPVEIDVNNTTGYPVVTSIGIDAVNTINIPASDDFKGNFYLEFYNLEASSNTDISKHTWTSNSLLIKNGDFTEEYIVELIVNDNDESGGYGITGGFLTSSGYYWLEIAVPDSYVWEP